MSKRTKSLLVITLLLCWITSAHAQTTTLRKGIITIDSTVICLDTLSIVPRSLILYGIPDSAYSLNLATATIKIIDNHYLGQQVRYQYRVFSINFAASFFHKPVSLNSPQRNTYAPNISSIIPLADKAADDEGGIQGTGSIARGISVGNNQDFVLNSSLNLQLSGFLAEGIAIDANITDKNVPIQPDGNTRSIQDFDKIFIRLHYHDQFHLNAGDLEIDKPDSYFINLSRKIIGMEFTTNNYIKDSSNYLQNSVGAGLAKGKYIRKSITTLNGVQGPYQLTGQESETNIVILAGSERVYLDGKLLTRGADNDYTMDYNAGEITFSSRILITSEKRITVEYEYSDQSYTRFSLYTFNEFTHEKNDKLKIGVNYFHEQDLKSRSVQPELSNEQMQFLSTIGDETSDTRYPNVTESSYNQNEILYKKIDTLVNGSHYNPVYVHSTNANDQLYRLGFCYVGEQSGNYILSQSTGNGRVFRWIAPIDSIPQGNYEPVVNLNTPSLSLMASVKGSYQFTDNTVITSEIALSDNDQNLFSNNDDNDNVGMAYYLHFKHKKKLRKNSDWLFSTHLDYEFVHKNFRPIESYRDIEFSRNYNLTEDYSTAHTENMLSFFTAFGNNDIGVTSYTLNYFSRYKDVNALKNDFSSTTDLKGFHFSTQTSYLYSDDQVQNTHYLQSYNHLSKSFKHIEVGVKENLEYDLFTDNETKKIRENSFAFNEITAYIKNSTNLPWQYGFLIKNRIDNKVVGEQLSNYDLIHEASSYFETTKIKSTRLRGNATYRNSRRKDADGDYKSENYFIGSVEYSGRYFHNALILSTYYETGSGMEQKKSYTFLKVASGQGTHTWHDFNGNGIEEIDEFEVAIFQDEADYIKIWQTTNDYINIISNQFNQNIQLCPYNAWNQKTGFKKWLSKFGESISLRILQKNNLQNTIKAFNPFLFGIPDSSLANQSVNFNNSFHYNQNNLYFGADYVINLSMNKELLYYGIDRTKTQSQEVILRGNPQKNIIIKTKYGFTSKNNNADYSKNRQYNIVGNSISQIINCHFKNSIFFDITYQYQNKKNKSGEEHSIHNIVALNVNYRVAKRGNLTAEIKYTHIKTNKTIGENLQYEMLEGLQSGNNGSWGLKYQVNLSEYLQLDLYYEGRISESNKAIHTGSVQVSAHF